MMTVWPPSPETAVQDQREWQIEWQTALAIVREVLAGAVVSLCFARSERLSRHDSTVEFPYSKEKVYGSIP
jgi:hypothetical protein